MFDVVSEQRKCKRIQNNVIKKTYAHNVYKNRLFTRNAQMKCRNAIISHIHEIYTEERNKVAVSSNDVEIVLLDDGIHTTANGDFNLHLP
jgi:DNA polymerase II small subunit/DNA polymerase delta subunit B